MGDLEPLAETLRRANVMRALLKSRGLLVDSAGGGVAAADEDVSNTFSAEHFLLGAPSPMRTGCVGHVARGGLAISPLSEDLNTEDSVDNKSEISRRGVALVAGRDFKAGDLLWEEGPISALQQGRHRVGRVCGMCFRFLGAGEVEEPHDGACVALTCTTAPREHSDAARWATLL